jgi:flavin-dependent dehydrogenase
VLVRVRGGDAPGEPEVVEADLVVDASGRGSRTPQWLTALGAAAPSEERIETGLAYATRQYRSGSPPRGDYRGIYLVPHPRMPRAAVVLPIEGPGAYLVTISGLGGDEPSTDPEQFETFAAEMEHPIVAEWIATAQAQGPPMGHRGTANVRRRYDRLPGPDGLLVVGDAAAAFNPIYGQGISVAALGAQALGRSLAGGVPSVRALQRVVRQVGEQAWSICSGVDKTMPGATGNAARRRGADRIADWYLGRVQDYSPGYRHVAVAFRDVLHLLEPTSVLFSWRVARSVLFGRRPVPLPEPPLYADPSDGAAA